MGCAVELKVKSGLILFMALGILSDEAARIELERFGIHSKELESHLSDEVNKDNLEDEAARSPDNVISFQTIERGRGDKQETPESIRKFIAAEAICGASPDVLSEEFNISKSSISAYKKGATSTASYHNPNADLLLSNQSAIDRIIGPAQARIIKAIQSITDEKLDGSKAKDAAGIAASLSSVVKNLRPEEKSGTNLQINVFAPRKNDEEDYEIIQVNQ